MDLTAYYDRYWAGKDDSFDRSRLCLLTRSVPRGSCILEVGCGPGILGRLLREKEVRVVGADLSKVALVRAGREGVAPVLCELDGAPFPFKDASFQYAASNSSLEHLFHPGEAIGEIHRILKKHGKFYWMVPNIGHWRYRLWLCLGRFPTVPNSPTDPLHLRMFTLHDATRLLKEEGFAIRSVGGSPGTWVPGLYPGWLRMPGARHLYERLAPAWPSLLCRYLVLEAEKIDAH